MAKLGCIGNKKWWRIISLSSSSTDPPTVGPYLLPVGRRSPICFAFRERDPLYRLITATAVLGKKPVDFELRVELTADADLSILHIVSCLVLASVILFS
ncbi:hypothetical protein F2P81_024981 [Scophthalmus maximus]|uniref:Uncharacterized protein n=1 Tax=Scophthalmus maximus TaxID=52904 RepID=A0A6A4RUF2_SCOMX|nr:hypothetical protein F2P81_024981 [Scophthalmus maximus]